MHDNDQVLPECINLMLVQMQDEDLASGFRNPAKNSREKTEGAFPGGYRQVAWWLLLSVIFPDVSNLKEAL